MRDTLKLRLKKATQGEGWTHVELKDMGPDIGHPYQTPKERGKLQENVEPSNLTVPHLPVNYWPQAKS